MKSFDESKYDFNEKDLSDIELNKELDALRKIKRSFLKSIDRIDTEIIRIKEEFLCRKSKRLLNNDGEI